MLANDLVKHFHSTFRLWKCPKCDHLLECDEVVYREKLTGKVIGCLYCIESGRVDKFMEDEE